MCIRIVCCFPFYLIKCLRFINFMGEMLEIFTQTSFIKLWIHFSYHFILYHSVWLKIASWKIHFIVQIFENCFSICMVKFSMKSVLYTAFDVVPGLLFTTAICILLLARISSGFFVCLFCHRVVVVQCSRVGDFLLNNLKMVN